MSLVQSNSGLGRERDAKSTLRGFIPEADTVVDRRIRTPTGSATNITEKLGRVVESAKLLRRGDAEPERQKDWLRREADAEITLRESVPGAGRIISSTCMTDGPAISSIAEKLERIVGFVKRLKSGAGGPEAEVYYYDIVLQMDVKDVNVLTSDRFMDFAKKLGEQAECFLKTIANTGLMDILTSKKAFALIESLPDSSRREFLECFILVASARKFITPVENLIKNEYSRRRFLADLIIASPDNIEGSKFAAIVENLPNAASRHKLLADVISLTESLPLVKTLPIVKKLSNEASRHKLLANFISLVEKLPDESSRHEFFEFVINAARNNQRISGVVDGHEIFTGALRSPT